MDLEQIKELDKKYYFGVFGERMPVCFVRGEGCRLYDTEGREYTDFFGGIAVNVLGHGNARLKAALHAQVDAVVHTSSIYYIEQQARLAALLCENSCMDKAFFCNSGAEANEGAIKLALKYSYEKGEKRKKIVSAKNSFHGRTMYTLFATGQEKFHIPYAPLPADFVHIPYGDIGALFETVDGQTCAVLMETVQGEGGVIPASPGYMQAVRDACDKAGALLILDEIQTGLGRTGKLFSYMHYGMEPDIMTLAKALGGGVPIGAILAKQHAADAFKKGDHGSTFGGNPLACAAGIAVMEELLDTGVIENGAKMGGLLKASLEGLMQRLPAIKSVRGLGLMLGVELEESHKAADAARAMLEKGFVIGTAEENTLRLTPPLIITKAETHKMLEALEQVLSGSA
ncbi:MAG: aspartate aminotransferase family protein [Bacillota bacterium]|nr:aspartate aminotransferase family protein [Bacillota bacterium]